MPKLYYNKSDHPFFRKDYPMARDNKMPREEGSLIREECPMPPETKIPKETVYSLDEYNEHVEIPEHKEDKVSTLKKLFLKPILSLIVIGGVFIASNGIDPLGDNFLGNTLTVMTNAVQQVTESVQTASDTDNVVALDTDTAAENGSDTAAEVTTTDSEPTDEDADVFPTLGNLNPDFAGDFAWSGDGSEEYVRFLGSGETNYTYLVKGSAWDTYDPSGTLVASADGASYDRASNTLTLQGLYAGMLDVNLMGNGFTINLIGNNTIDNIAIWGAMYGGSVTFTGDGSLTVNNGINLNCEGSESCLMVKKGVTLDLYGEPPVIIGDSTMKQTLYLSKSLKVTGGTIEQSDENEFDGRKMYTFTFTNENGEPSKHIKIEPAQ